MRVNVKDDRLGSVRFYVALISAEVFFAVDYKACMLLANFSIFVVFSHQNQHRQSLRCHAISIPKLKVYRFVTEESNASPIPIRHMS